MPTRVAVIQAPPRLLDLEASLEVAIALTDEAAAAGADLLVFPEAYLPGYPTWIWRLRPGEHGAPWTWVATTDGPISSP